MMDTGERSNPGALLAYVAFLLLVLIPASGLLHKAGVPAHILSAAAWVVLLGATILPVIPAVSRGFHAYARPDPVTPVPLAALLTMAAMLPAGMALAVASAASWQFAAFAAGAPVLGLVVSFALRRVSGGALHPAELAHFVEERSGSRWLALAVCLLLAMPLFAILCGQTAAFSRLAEAYLGMGFALAVAFCLVLAAVQVLLAGATGIVLGSAGLFLAVLATALLAWMHPDSEMPIARTPDLAGIAVLALPFLPSPEEIADTVSFSASLAVIGLGFGVLPSLSLDAVSPRQPLRRDLLALAMVVSLLLALGWIFQAWQLPTDAMHGPAIRVVGEMANRLAQLLLLAGLMVCAAVPLFSIALLAASLLRPNLRGHLPGRRLALARFSILLVAAAAGWVVVNHEAAIAPAARVTLAMAAALVPPVCLALLLRQASVWVGLAAMSAGAAAAVTADLAAGAAPPLICAALACMLAASAVVAAAWIARLRLLRRGS